MQLRSKISTYFVNGYNEWKNIKWLNVFIKHIEWQTIINLEQNSKLELHRELSQQTVHFLLVFEEFLKSVDVNLRLVTAYWSDRFLNHWRICPGDATGSFFLGNCRIIFRVFLRLILLRVLNAGQEDVVFVFDVFKFHQTKKVCL